MAVDEVKRSGSRRRGCVGPFSLGPRGVQFLSSSLRLAEIDEETTWKLLMFASSDVCPHHRHQFRLVLDDEGLHPRFGRSLPRRRRCAGAIAVVEVGFACCDTFFAHPSADDGHRPDTLQVHATPANAEIKPCPPRPTHRQIANPLRTPVVDCLPLCPTG